MFVGITLTSFEVKMNCCVMEYAQNTLSRSNEKASLGIWSYWNIEKIWVMWGKPCYLLPREVQKWMCKNRKFESQGSHGSRLSCIFLRKVEFSTVLSRRSYLSRCFYIIKMCLKYTIVFPFFVLRSTLSVRQ